MRTVPTIAVAAWAAFAGCRGGRGLAVTRDAGAESLPLAADAATPAIRHGTAPPPCRAVQVAGDVRPADPDADAAGPQLATEQEIREPGWVVLAPGARLVAKDPRTTRETSVSGPARARVCVDHREEAWICDGTFESATGSGETPGAEQWVVTPDAVVRYAAAKLRVDVGPKGSSATLLSGTAFIWAPGPVSVEAVRHKDGGAAAPSHEDMGDAPWRRVSDGTVHVARGSTDDAAPSSAGDCAARADRSQRLAGELFARHGLAGPEAGALIADQVRERRLARASCALASVRVALLSPSAEAERAAAALRRGIETLNRGPIEPGPP